MKKDDIIKRIDEIIRIGNQIKYSDLGFLISVELDANFRVSSLSLIENIYGKNHSFYKEFNENKNRSGTTEIGIGILNSIKDEINGGWIFKLNDIVAAEIFSDFLDMANYQLIEGYKDPSAVIIGGVLEDQLRRLCTKYNIPITIIKNDKEEPKKANLLNDELYKAKIYDSLNQKSVSSWLDLRNKAAHGKYNEYTKEQVSIMYDGVLNFITRIS